MPSSLSLYIHFPFCKKKCKYCDFYSCEYSEEIFNSYLDSLITEWSLIKKRYLKETFQITTLFMGGGTPSILSLSSWEIFQEKFLSSLPLNEDPEITLECNPESFTEKKADTWINSGVNRLSIGVQSLNDNELNLLGRIHNSNEVFNLLNSDSLSKFKSVNVDIMFGIPDQTAHSLEHTIEQLLKFDIIKHLSIYELTLAEGTHFFENSKHLTLPNDDTISEMNSYIIKKLKENQFYQYEVSNFSKENFQCQHNLNYWNYSPYIGLGPGAHSFINPVRWANVRNTNSYIELLSEEKQPVDFEERLNKYEIFSELIFLGLRTSLGIDEKNIEKLSGIKFIDEKRDSVLKTFIKEKLLTYNKGFWKPTDKGILFADVMAEKLI